MKLTQLTEQEERPYVVFHTKKGKYETHAVSSYDAAKNAAKHWGLKSTAGVTPKLADVEHVAEKSDKNCGCGQDPCVTYGNKSHQAESKDTQNMEYSVRMDENDANDNYLSYDDAIRLYDKYKAQGYDDVQLDARIKESVNMGRKKFQKMPLNKPAGETRLARLKTTLKQLKDQGDEAGVEVYQKLINQAEKREKTNEAEKRWKQTSMSPEEAIEKYGKENVKVKKGALRNGDDMVEVFVESYSPGDELEDGVVSNCCGAPLMDYNDGHGRCSDCKEMAAGEEFYESYSNDGKTVTISDYQPEGDVNAHKKFNLRKQIHRGEDGKAIKSPYGGYKVSFHGSAEDVKAYAEKNLGEAKKKQKPFYDKPLKEEESIKPIKGSFDWANSMSDETLKALKYAMNNDWDVLDGIKDLADFKKTIDIFFTNEGTPVPEDIAKIFNKLLARDEKNIAKFNEFIRRAFVDAGEELEELDTMFENSNESLEEDEEAIAARDEFLKVMDMKPKSSHKAIDTIKKIVADKQNMQVKFDDGKMKVDLYTASAVAAVYNAVNDVNKEKIDDMLRTKEGMLRMSNFAFSKLKEGIAEGKRIDEILPLVGAIAGAIGRKVAGSAVKNVAKKAAGAAAMGTANAAGSAVGNAAQSSGMNASAKAKGKKLNAVKEAGGYYTQPVYDMIKQHGYPKVMHRLLSALDADVIQDFINREPDLDESVNEADIVGDNYANVYYDYSESFYMIDVYKDGKKVAEYDDYIGANEEGDPIKDKFLELVKKAGLEPEGLNLVSTGGDEPDEFGVFKNGKFNWDKNEALPAVGTAVAGGLKKAAGAVGKLANKADTAAFGLKAKSGVKYNANSPQGKMIRNMSKNGKTQGAKSDAKKDLVKGTVADLKKKVGGLGGIMKTAAGSSGFLPASKQFAQDMIEQAIKDADK